MEEKWCMSLLSFKRLQSCHTDLIKLFTELEKDQVQFTITCGHRNKENQDKAFSSGNSKVKWPDSRHNSIPSNAVDACPLPINWTDIEAFKKFGEIVKKKAKELNISICWGGDWSKFKDYPHYEIIVSNAHI